MKNVSVVKIQNKGISNQGKMFCCIKPERWNRVQPHNVEQIHWNLCLTSRPVVYMRQFSAMAKEDQIMLLLMLLSGFPLLFS